MGRMIRESRRLEHGRYLHTLFRQLPGAVWTTNRELRITYVTGRVVHDMGHRVKRGMSIAEVIGTQDATNIVIASHRAALAGEPQTFEYQLGERWYSVHVEQLRDDGEVAGCIAAAYDI